MTIYPNAFGTAVDFVIIADTDILPAEREAPREYTREVSSVLAFNLILSAITSTATQGRITQTAKPRAQTIFRFTTADIQPQGKGFSIFPIENTLILAWNANVDFIIEFDFTVMPIMMNMKSELMDLLENRRQLEDPSVSNTQGKRVLPRAPLLVPEE